MADVTFGYVYDFGAREEWVAERGRGARLNDLPLDGPPPKDPIEILSFGATAAAYIRDRAAPLPYCRPLPPSDNRPGDTHFTVAGRVAAAFGAFDLTPAATIDHSPRVRVSPPIAATADYGAYLAASCTGCHGANLAGQHVPGTPPEFPDAANLTPHADGLAGWQDADFQRVLRTGKRPDGRQLHPFMPWRAYSRMTDTEIAALWAHLSTLPPTASARKK